MTPQKAFWLFIVFSGMVFVIGGGSRYDIESVGILRGAAAVFVAIGVWYQTRETAGRLAAPIGFVLALAALMAVQLVPLPHSWWSSLPGRSDIAQLDALVGLGEQSRPLTLSPQRTLNSLTSLVVPLAAFLLLALLDDESWRRIVKAIAIAGAVSALVGILQFLVPSIDGLYFYEITNRGSAVGLFSNRNHNALFLNLALLCTFFRYQRESDAKWAPKNFLWIAARLVILLAVLINGSRFGLIILAAVGIFVSTFYFVRTRQEYRASRATSLVIAGTAVLSLILVSAFALMERVPAIERMAELSLSNDLRSRSLPYVLDLMKEHLLVGTGFGTFEQAYRTIEPLELMGRAYLNHAHNDWIQVVIEGGIVAVLLLLSALAVLLLRGKLVWSERKSLRHDTRLNWLGLSMIVLIALHSFFDYPLRTPSLMVVAAVAVGMWMRSFDKPVLRRSR